jgi:hypothetical protein
MNKRNLAYKMSDFTYRHKHVPFARFIRRWRDKLELGCVLSDGICITETIRWWHKYAYRAGMWGVQFKRVRRLSDWVVHRIPYECRFYLA